MTMLRADEAAALVAGLMAAFPEVVIGVETVQIYARFLVDADADHAALAVAKWIAKGKRFPRISELRESIERERGGAPPDIDQAWKEAMTAARSGRLPLHGWSHSAVRLAVEAVGFRELRMTDTPGVERAHFEKAYNAARLRTSDAGVPALAQGLVKDMRALMSAPAEKRAQIEADEAQQRGRLLAEKGKKR